MYKFGSGVEVDMTMAVSYYEKALACKGDMPFASYALGQAYELGQGVKADEQKATQRYTQALTGFTAIYEKSREDSISYRLGTMYLKGKGTDVDLAKAENTSWSLLTMETIRLSTSSVSCVLLRIA